MRKFKLIRWEKSYSPLIQDGVYDSFMTPEGWSETIEECAKRFPYEWHEVFEPETKKTHRDTDLGYFAGLICAELAKSWGAGHEVRCCEDSIKLAKELIKQLDKQTK